MGHLKRVRYKSRSRKVGERPGMINPPDDAVKPIIKVYSYNEHELVTDEGHDLKIVLDQLKNAQIIPTGSR
ncbi:hypothetical protein HK413_11870 [Mucilaginibacter sp. S1162]|uniref:Uncharacterized protein n=1 Tax=Mucilaginibacter humi TaxID=2732510 RepID=A0ABX1W2Z8_9SPHI|nr:hypothetical protein [Mucilaginibacter humi]NNU34602.1 hypothetical protein [Mucilaginibacter humi]